MPRLRCPATALRSPLRLLPSPSQRVRFASGVREDDADSYYVCSSCCPHRCLPFVKALASQHKPLARDGDYQRITLALDTRTREPQCSLWRRLFVDGPCELVIVQKEKAAAGAREKMASKRLLDKVTTHE